MQIAMIHSLNIKEPKENIYIHRIPMGTVNCYVIQAQGVIMLDCGTPKKEKNFIKGIKRGSIAPNNIRLIVITHGHYDYIESAKKIKEVTGARIAMDRNEKDCLEKSLKILLTGVTSWSRILIKMIKMFMPFINISPGHVDIVLEDEGFPLTEYGIPVTAIHTPGHSSRSLSVLFETGEVFVGDLAINHLLLRFKPGLPIFADDLQQARRSLQMLLEPGAKIICPAHGKPFPFDNILKAL